jgi:hypothetical protein
MLLFRSRLFRLFRFGGGGGGGVIVGRSVELIKNLRADDEINSNKHAAVVEAGSYVDSAYCYDNGGCIKLFASTAAAAAAELLLSAVASSC